MKLTREEIENKPAGRELDMLIALIDGWKLDDLTAVSPSGSRNDRTRHGDDHWLEYYSTDMSAVWNVAEKIFCGQGGFGITVYSGRCAFSWAPNNGDIYEFVEAETAPLVISRALLISEMMEAK
jgi:hypothetical protein